jgi:hypothetical protein
MAKDSSARLLITAGSLMLRSGSVPQCMRADAALVADVAAELATVRLGYPALGVTLAAGETTATLLARACAAHPDLEPMRKAVLALGPVGLHDGLGSIAGLGHVAGLVALDHDRINERIARELVIPVLRRCNGSLGMVAIWVMNSLAGGVGALGGRVFAGAAAEQFRSLSSAMVDILSFQVGALTFLGLGDRIFDNAAAGLVEHLAALTDPDRDPRESRQLFLAELPTVDTRGKEIGPNRELRSTLATSLAAAFAAEEVQQRVQTGRTNRALGEALRGVTVLQAGWYGGISGDEVVAAAARHYLGELDRSSPPAESPECALEFVESPISRERSTVAELSAVALGARGVKPPHFESEALAEVNFSVTIRIDGVPAAQPVQSALTLAADGRPGEALRQLVRNQVTLASALASARSRVTRDAGRAESLKSRLRNAIRAVFPEAGIPKAWQFLAGGHGAVRAFEIALQSWRDAQTRYALAAARVTALQAAWQAVAAALERIQAVFARVRATLESIAGSATRSNCTHAPLDEVAAGFFRSVASGDLPLLRSELASSARAVTADGLARMVDAPSAQPGDIAARLLAGPRFAAPFWGGGVPPTPPFLRAIVLPPIAPAFLEALRDAASAAHLPGELLCGETLAGGAAVVGLHAHEVLSIADLFPAPYLSGLREVAGPQRSLYPLSNRACALMDGLLTREAVCA